MFQSSDFRPEYHQLGRIKEEILPSVPVMALTATATPQVQQDILCSLRMKSPAVFNVSFYRSNLTFRVVTKDYSVDKDTQQPQWMVDLLSFISSRPQETGIVYCLSRDDAEGISALINTLTNVPAAFYHAGMTPKQRTGVQNAWRKGEVLVVAATIAFGMGIDHATVRYVLHAAMSKSLEGYYQEAGRAGRDCRPAECVLFYGRRDGPRILNLMRRGRRSTSGNKSFQREVQQFHAVTEYCGNDRECRHAQMLRYFGESWEMGSCKDKCDVCRGEVVPMKSTKPRNNRNKGAAPLKRKGDADTENGPSSVGFTSAASAWRAQAGNVGKPPGKDVKRNTTIFDCLRSKN